MGLPLISRAAVTELIKGAVDIDCYTPQASQKSVLLLLPLWPFNAGATTILSIGDGDTIRVLQAGKALTVRVACIDAPKTAQGPYGQKARAYLQQRLPIGCPVSTTYARPPT